jgi:hypothetical protein
VVFLQYMVFLRVSCHENKTEPHHANASLFSSRSKLKAPISYNFDQERVKAKSAGCGNFGGANIHRFATLHLDRDAFCGGDFRVTGTSG